MAPNTGPAGPKQIWILLQYAQGDVLLFKEDLVLCSHSPWQADKSQSNILFPRNGFVIIGECRFSFSITFINANIYIKTKPDCTMAGNPLPSICHEGFCAESGKMKHSQAHSLSNIYPTALSHFLQPTQPIFMFSFQQRLFCFFEALQSIQIHFSTSHCTLRR